MELSELAAIAIRVGGLSLAVYALIGQVVKPLLRIIAKRQRGNGRLTKGQEAFYAWLTRALSVGTGAGLGFLPLWPDHVMAAWGPLLGVVAGSFAPALHAAVGKVIPEAVARLISGRGVE